MVCSKIKFSIEIIVKIIDIPSKSTYLGLKKKEENTLYVGSIVKCSGGHVTPLRITINLFELLSPFLP